LIHVLKYNKIIEWKLTKLWPPTLWNGKFVLLYFIPLPYDILILTFEMKISDLVVKNELCCRLCKNIQFWDPSTFSKLCLQFQVFFSINQGKILSVIYLEIQNLYPFITLAGIGNNLWVSKFLQYLSILVV